jgi:hypothetical protein
MSSDEEFKITCPIFATDVKQGNRQMATISLRKVNAMNLSTLLWTVAIVLVLMWLLGMVTAHTIGGFIHVLLVVALIVVLIRVIQGRRSVR